MVTLGVSGANLTQQQTTTLASPDSKVVNQFAALMQAAEPTTATSTSTSTFPADAVEATDAELARLPESELARLREQWGEDDHGFRCDAKMLLDMRENILRDAILKDIKKASSKASIL